MKIWQKGAALPRLAKRPRLAMEEQSAGEEMRAAEVTLVDANEDGNSMQDAGEEENTAPVVVEKDEEDNIPIIRKEKKNGAVSSTMKPQKAMMAKTEQTKRKGEN